MAPTAKQVDSAAPDVSGLDTAAIEAGLPSFDADTLAALIRRTNHEYWNLHAPTIPDPVYDRLVEGLRRLDPAHPVLDELGEATPEGPVIEADATASIPPAERLGAPVRHTRAMLSLDKCYGPEDLYSWTEKFEGEVLVMPKMDGVACSLRYDAEGKLFLAATRGNGSEGEDITVNVLEVEDVPQQLDPAAFAELPGPDGAAPAVEVRGELFMKLSVFERYKEQYSNPRNLTAGAIKHKERGKTKAYTLSFYAYDLQGTELPTEREKFASLRALGFAVEECDFVPRGELQAAYERWSARRSADEIDYEIDGVVYRASEVAEQRRMGETGHHPRWSMAYKFQGDTGTTTLEEVLWSVSRTGTITPVAIFKPIELSGAMIARAGLFNLNHFDELGLTAGAAIEVTRRGGVIPYVERVVTPGAEGETFDIPKRCPACNSEAVRRKKRDGEFLYCSKPEGCGSARLGELQHFAKVVDIQGFGPKVVTQAVDAGLLSSPADFYTLRVEDLEEFDRLGRRSAENLVAQVDAHRRIELPIFLQSLGIDHLGKQNAVLLANEFRTLAGVRGVSREALLEVKGIKDAIADALLAGLETRAELIDALLEHVTVVDLPERDPEAEAEAAAAAAEGALGGKTFLFTGALEAFTRKQAQEKVEANGGVPASGVSKSLDYLVVGAGKGAKSSKQKKAEKLIDGGAALKVISEGDFLAMIGE
ncbi:DNA ligase, NAD-dependent [Plesiocystis pacifica SIR-1]|uniref:DNA ligase n=1 Tax=Plesiocystis pacifica SIR-1 TaxID=391625 RepID=A6GI82_9BACT|nr:NAD-dependent DNA ligase LigA [Plesiocystis pacifica]EDM74426.1 DNA ligase, NAD-dependent [Plesiocystis pacifica SIR-1]